jgi:hypothetical protein
MKYIGLFLLVMLGIMLIGCSTSANVPTRFHLVYKETAPMESRAVSFELIQDTQTGACWFVLYGSGKGGPAPAPKEACEASK